MIKYQPDNTVIKHLFKSIEKLMKISRNLPIEIKNSHSRDSLKKEFLTIRMSLPRRMGNTTLAKRLLDKYKDSFYICWTKGNIDGKEYKDRVLYVKSKNLVGKSADIVVVDTASYMSNEDLRNIYNIEANNYVLLG